MAKSTLPPVELGTDDIIAPSSQELLNGGTQLTTKEEFLQRKSARVIAGCLLSTASLVIFLVVLHAGERRTRCSQH